VVTKISFDASIISLKVRESFVRHVGQQGMEAPIDLTQTQTSGYKTFFQQFFGRIDKWSRRTNQQIGLRTQFRGEIKLSSQGCAL